MYTICEVSKVYCNNKTIVLFSKSECFLFPLEQLCAYENPVTILMMIQKYTNKKLSETENRIRSIEAGSFRGGRVWRISVAGGECPSVLNRNSRGTKKMGKHWAQPAASSQPMAQPGKCSIRSSRGGPHSGRNKKTNYFI